MSIYFPIAPSTLSNPPVPLLLPGAPRAPLQTVPSATAHISLVGKLRRRQVRGLFPVSQPEHPVLSHKAQVLGCLPLSTPIF